MLVTLSIGRPVILFHRVCLAIALGLASDGVGRN